MITEQSPILSMKEGGVPPATPNGPWDELFARIVALPDDGCWLQVRMRAASDTQRCRASINKWRQRNADQLDCAIETRVGPSDVLWVRKNLRENPNYRKPHDAG